VILGLTIDEREIIENAYRANIIRVIVCTSTLSSGVIHLFDRSALLILSDYYIIAFIRLIFPLVWSLFEVHCKMVDVLISVLIIKWYNYIHLFQNKNHCLSPQVGRAGRKGYDDYGKKN
jgi:hypothetical protein